MLKVNPKKTKIMIFHKRPRKSVDINFNLGTEPIEIAQEYTYLGTRLTPTGNFTLALEHLKEKALHAFSSIRKHTLLNRLNPNTAFQIFDTMIFPILSYNIEIWGMYTKQNFKTWDSFPVEKIRLKFCKHYLEVNNKVGGVGVPNEIVQEYTYLGTRLTPTGNFTLALEHLKEKALHAFSSIRKHTLLNRLYPNTASQIFDTMIFPILSYNIEIWGMYTKQNFKTWDSSPIEKIRLKFCKHYLEVNNKASNVACRAELERLPLIIPINQKIMKYFV